MVGGWWRTGEWSGILKHNMKRSTKRKGKKGRMNEIKLKDR